MQKNNQNNFIDYRNARYQGCVSSQGLRNQLGILIDDDLSFYVSQWYNNKLNGNTLVYIEHGKYIYGTWYQNQPHGLNVFRSGDTVLIGFFEEGQIEGKIIVIFERHNIIALLTKSRNSDSFSVLNCGKLLNHEELIKYIDLLEIKMPQNYFSLIKYVESFVNPQHFINSSQVQNNQIIVQPCKHNHCYFGYKEGLGIVFNSNNGVVSVGNHEKMQLTGYGGKFKGRKVEQGNFELGETVCYNTQRPTSQIYSIFHKMHKRSLTFKNQYFDSKVKTLKTIQNILRQNLDKIVSFSIKNKGESLNVVDLNDSLDYQNFEYLQQIGYPVQEDFIQTRSNASQTGNKYSKKKQSISEARQNMYMNQAYQEEGQNDVKIQTDISSYKQTKNKKQNTDSRSPIRKQKKQQSPQVQNKKRNVYIAKKSLLHKQKEIQQTAYKRQKSALNKQNQQKLKSPLKSKNLSIQTQQNINEEKFSKSNIKRHTNQCYRMPRYSQATLPNQFQDEKASKNNIKQRHTQSRNIPKFNGLLQNESHIHQNHTFGKIQQFVDHENSLEVYRQEISKSRSIAKQKRQSISKILKRPNYLDIQQRRKKIVDQFRGLNKAQNQNQINRKLAPQQIKNHQQNLKPYDSPYNRQKILISDLSQNQNGSSQCSLGLIPLSLMKKEDKILKQSTSGNIFNRIQLDNKVNTTNQKQKACFRRQNPQNRDRSEIYMNKKIKQTNQQIKEKRHKIENNFNGQLKDFTQSSNNISQVSSRQRRKAYKYYFD